MKDDGIISNIPKECKKSIFSRFSFKFDKLIKAKNIVVNFLLSIDKKDIKDKMITFMVMTAFTFGIIIGSFFQLNKRKKKEIQISTSSLKRLELLEKYYLNNLVEDPIDGTHLDCDVLDAIKELKTKHSK